MAARINFDESVRIYAHDTASTLDAEDIEWANEHWEEYFFPDGYDTDDPEELAARFKAVWQLEMVKDEE